MVDGNSREVGGAAERDRAARGCRPAHVIAQRQGGGSERRMLPAVVARALRGFDGFAGRAAGTLTSPPPNRLPLTLALSPIPPSLPLHTQITASMVEIKRQQKRLAGRSFTPSVIEPSFGIGRILYCVFEHCYYTREVCGGEGAVSVCWWGWHLCVCV